MERINDLRSLFTLQILLFLFFIDEVVFNKYVEAGPVRLAFAFDAYRYVLILIVDVVS